MSSMVPNDRPEGEFDDVLDGLDRDPIDPGPDPDPELDPDGAPAFGGLLDQEPPITGLGGAGITYEVSGWSGESRALLDSLLSSEDIAHMWQGTALTVPSDAEEVVEALIDDVIASASPALEPDRARVVYEVGDWAAGTQTSLAESLAVADIPYEWNEAGDLVVYADDEEQVDEILEAMPDPDEQVADADGLDTQQVLSALFLASGRLAKNPRDADGVLGVAGAAEKLEKMMLPFGFEAPTWRALVERALALRDGLEAEVDKGGPAWSDDDVAEAAADLRDRLRRLV